MLHGQCAPLKTQAWSRRVTFARVSTAAALLVTQTLTRVSVCAGLPLENFPFRYSRLVAFFFLKLILHFIRSNIIDYIIKCRMYIIKISQHFTGHLIKISGAVPKGINLHEALSTYHSAVFVSTLELGPAPWEGETILQRLSRTRARGLKVLRATSQLFHTRRPQRQLFCQPYPPVLHLHAAPNFSSL